MGHDDELKQLLVEIRDNQRLSLRKQEGHLEVSCQQIERARRQVANSIRTAESGDLTGKDCCANRHTGRIVVHRADRLSDLHVLVGANAVDPVGANN